MGKVLLKYSLLIQFVLFINLLWVHGQTNLKEVTHYLFPEFTKGVVLMKTGFRNEVVLNYNSLTQEMIFETRGTKLALSMLESIDTVFIADRKFVPKQNYFIELVFKSKYSLYVDHKCKLKDPGKPAGYGGTSQTSAITTYSTYLTGGRVYEMKLPEGFETQSSIEYWLDKDGKLNKFISIRQLSKLFDEEESSYKAYLKKHEVNYDNRASIIEFLRHMGAN